MKKRLKERGSALLVVFHLSTGNYYLRNYRFKFFLILIRFNRIYGKRLKITFVFERR